MNSFPQNSTIVLVHGAWADGSSWNNVTLPLEHQGLRVTCAPIPLTSLAEDIAALNRALERTSGPVVLAGHAYGGGVIGAISEERVKSFVYVAALAPDEGETVAQVFYRDEPHRDAPKLTPDRHGFIWMPEDGFSRAVAHKASIDQTRIMAAVQRPHFDSVYSSGSAGAGMEGEAILVSACGRRPHDQSKDAAIYGGSNGREGPLEPRGP
jgi:pimeloyl-ACP methyl ester carboxylesterase